MRLLSITSLALSATVFALTGCTQQLPAPTAPTKEVPAVDVPDEPPPNGEGRVLLDANGEKAKVVEITGASTGSVGRYYATMVGVRPLCTTPCVVDLTYGSHPIIFQSTTDESHVSGVDLDVGPKAKVVRHAIGERNDGGGLHTAGTWLLLLGATTALTGAILWGVGALANSSSPTGAAHTSSITSTGQLITGIGAGGVALSIPFLILGRPSIREGSTTEWSVPSTNGGHAPTDSKPTAIGPQIGPQTSTHQL